MKFWVGGGNNNNSILYSSTRWISSQRINDKISINAALSWRWCQQVPSQCQHLSTIPHDDAYRKVGNFILTAVRISDHTATFVPPDVCKRLRFSILKTKKSSLFWNSVPSDWRNKCLEIQLLLRQHLVYSTVQYSTVQYSTIQYSTVQYSTVQYSTVQYSTVQ